MSIFLIIATTIMIPLAAHAQDPQHPDPVDPAGVHHHEGATEAVDRFYSRWMVPPARQSLCCNRIDCAAAETRLVDGHWEFRWINRTHEILAANGGWLRVPKRLIENYQTDPRESPDGLAHVCISGSGIPLCAVLGSGL
jgi:hypothetical protein